MIAIISDIVLSILTIVLAYIAWRTNYKHNKFYLESTAFNLIHNAKSALDKELIHLGEKSELGPLIEDYMNALNYACSLYKENKINKDRFKVLYTQDIMFIFSNESFQEILNLNCNDFTFLREIHVEFIENSRK